MPAKLSRRATLGLGAAGVVATPLARANAAPAGPGLPQTIDEARASVIPAGTWMLTVAGASRPGDWGTGFTFVRDPAIDGDHIAANPGTGFLDGGNAGFRRVETLGQDGAALVGTRGGGNVQDQLDRQGLYLDDTAKAGDSGNALQEIFTRLATPKTRLASARLGRGNWFLGDKALVLNDPRANLLGEGINISNLSSAVGARKTALTLRNYGGRVEHFCLDSGRPGDSPASARQVQRNGLLLAWSGGHGTVRSVEARWFNGFGIRIETIWDSIVENLITIACGNDERHAIEVTSVGDTSNHTNFNRVQAEDSFGKAILFDSSCLNLIVDGIHCEGTVGKAGQYAVSLLGSAMSYRNARIANDGGHVEILLGGGSNCYDRFTCEAGTITDYIWGEAHDSQRSFIQHSIFGTLGVPSRNVGKLVISDCTIDRLEIHDQTRTVQVVRCMINDVVISGNPTDVLFEGCDIRGSWTTIGNSTIRCRASTLAQLPQNWQLRLDACEVRGVARSGFNQQIHATDTRFAGDVVLAGDGSQIWLGGTFEIGGGLGCTSAKAFGACGDGGEVRGTVHPNWYGTGGTWPKGTTRHRLDASAGDVPFTRFAGGRWVSGARLS